MDSFRFHELTRDHVAEIAAFGKLLNPHKSLDELSGLLRQMFDMAHYHCFGLYRGQELLAVCSGWVSIRLYSGKQLEVDNVVVLESCRSQGVGTVFFGYIEDWAIANGCCTVELNTFLKNLRSHKFYAGRNYEALGYHFVKKLPGFSGNFSAETDDA